MALVHVLDNYYLAISFLICLGYQAIFFAISVGFKTDQLNDVAGGTNFVLLAIITVSMYGQHEARQIVDSIFIMIWGARLAGFLLFRIIKTGKDDRFDDKRGKFLPMLGFYTFQTLWVWTVSMPVTVLNSPIVNQYPQPAFNKATDILAVIGFGIGIIIETVSDIQKYRFKQNHKERGAVCNVGFFAWSRHPNYFAEILIQFCKSARYNVWYTPSDVFSSHLYARCDSCILQLRAWRCKGSSVLQRGWASLLDYTADVRVWSNLARTPWSEEEIRKG